MFEILKLNFGHDSDAKVISNILKLNFGQVEFGQDLMLGQDYEAEFSYKGRVPKKDMEIFNGICP